MKTTGQRTSALARLCVCAHCLGDTFMLDDDRKIHYQRKLQGGCQTIVCTSGSRMQQPN